MLVMTACNPLQQITPRAPEQPTPNPPPPIAAEEPLPARVGPVRVAILLPLSGNAAQIGSDMLSAAQMALFDVGENDLMLLPYDTGGTPEGATAAARDAVADDAELILGPLFATSARAVAPVAAENGLKVISFSNDASVAGNGVWVLGFRPEEQVERIMNYARERGLRRIGALIPDNAYGLRAASAWRTVADDPTLLAFYPPDATETAGIVREFTRFDARENQAADGTPVRSSPPPFDALLLPDGGNRLRSIAALLAYYDIDPTETQLLGTMLWQDDTRLLLEPTLQHGWFASVEPEAQNGFEQRFSRLFGHEPAAIVGLAYDATALAAVIALSDRSFPEPMLIEPGGFIGRAGVFRLRPDGLSDHGLAVLEVVGGQVRVLDPAPQSFGPALIQ